jgi:hypothetical protein
MCSTTFASRNSYTQGVDMDCRFQIWSAQNQNNIHPFKPNVGLY